MENKTKEEMINELKKKLEEIIKRTKKTIIPIELARIENVTILRVKFQDGDIILDE